MTDEERTPAEGSNEVRDEAAQEIGSAATGDVQIPVISYDEGMKYDAAREANREGWEATANELNDRRGFVEKIRDKNETTLAGVMHDEALRVNAGINRQLNSNLRENQWEEDHARRHGEPLREERIKPTTRQGVLEQLQADETEEMSEGYFRDEPLYNPKAEYSRRSASEIADRERKTKPISDKVNEALAAGDINGAEKALADSRELWKSIDDITMSEHITPELRRAVGRILTSDRKSLAALIEAKYLTAYIYPNMAIDAGVSPERLHEDDLKHGVTHLASDAIKRYGPHMYESDRAGSHLALEELTRRLDVLSRLGVMSREEIANDWVVRDKAEELAVETTAGEIARYPRDGFSLSSETWQLVRLGLIDLRQLADSTAMIRIYTMNTAAESKKIVNQARRELRKSLLGDEETTQESQQAA